MFWSDLVFGQKQGGNYEKPSRVSRLAAGAADARLLRPRPRAGRESIDADQRVSVNLLCTLVMYLPLSKFESIHWVSIDATVQTNLL